MDENPVFEARNPLQGEKGEKGGNGTEGEKEGETKRLPAISKIMNDEEGKPVDETVTPLVSCPLQGKKIGDRQ